MNKLVTFCALILCVNVIRCSDRYTVIGADHITYKLADSTVGVPALQKFCQRFIEQDFYEKVDRAFDIVIDSNSSEGHRQELQNILDYNKQMQEDKNTQDHIKLPSLLHIAYESDEKTLLHQAAMYNADNKIMKILLDTGVNIHAKDEEGRTPLHLAAFYNADQSVKLLLAVDANVHAKDKIGDTPLHMAVRGNAEKTTRQLVAVGVSVLIEDKIGCSPLSYSKYYIKKNEMKQLLLHGPEGKSARKIEDAYRNYKRIKLQKVAFTSQQNYLIS